jgi:GNAT superfamily N-acetyltransferase
MPSLEIQPFADEHLNDAGQLLAARHQRHRVAEPLLSDPADFRVEIETLWRGDDASGVVGIQNGRVVGFLLGIRKADAVWGPNVWIDPAGHAVERAEEIRDLYEAAAARWVDEGRTRHYTVVPATDGALLDAWYRLGFGQQQALAIREVPDLAMPAGARVAEERDLEALVELAPLLPDHQDLSPVFSSGPRDTEEELRAEISEDLGNPAIGNLVADVNGQVVGNFVVVPIEMSSMHAGLARVAGASLLGFAVTRPEVRGIGAGLTLTNASFAWARERGYKTMVTDWRVTNLLSSRFWPRRGFRTTFLRLYRSIP